LYRYRDDPVKREALISSGQAFPKWLAKWIFNEEASTSATKGSLPDFDRK
jgi:hypothetical protein